MDEDKEKIKADVRAAIESNRGNTKVAAIMLGMSHKKLLAIVASDPELSEAANPTPPTEVETISQIPLEVVQQKSQEELLREAVAREDAKFRSDLSGTGFTDKQVEQAMKLAELTKSGFTNTLSLIHGGMTANFLDALHERESIRKIQKGILDQLGDLVAFPHGSPDRVALLAESSTWSRRLREIDTVVKDCNTVIQQGAMTQLLVRGNKQKKTPSYAPTGQKK